MINDSMGSPRLSPVPIVASFARHAGWLSTTAGALFLIAQTVMWTFDQSQNLETSQDPVFVAAPIAVGNSSRDSACDAGHLDCEAGRASDAPTCAQ